MLIKESNTDNKMSGRLKKFMDMVILGWFEYGSLYLEFWLVNGGDMRPLI